MPCQKSKKDHLQGELQYNDEHVHDFAHILRLRYLKCRFFPVCSGPEALQNRASNAGVAVSDDTKDMLAPDIGYGLQFLLEPSFCSDLALFAEG